MLRISREASASGKCPASGHRQENLDQKNKKKGMKVISGEMLEHRSQSSQNYKNDKRNKKTS